MSIVFEDTLFSANQLGDMSIQTPLENNQYLDLLNNNLGSYELAKNELNINIYVDLNVKITNFRKILEILEVKKVRIYQDICNDQLALIVSAINKVNSMLKDICSILTFVRIYSAFSLDLIEGFTESFFKGNRDLVIRSRETSFNLILFENIKHLTSSKLLMVQSFHSWYKKHLTNKKEINFIFVRFFTLFGAVFIYIKRYQGLHK